MALVSRVPATAFETVQRLMREGTGLTVYAERDEPRLGKLDRIGLALSGAVAPFFRPRSTRFAWIVDRVNSENESMRRIKDEAILSFARDCGAQMRREGFTDELVAKAFALIREIATRRLGIRHFDVQLVGGLVLLKGLVAEMETGEGKTLTATLAAGTAALAGIPVHVVTVNDYLAVRDSAGMLPVYEAMGLTVGTIKQGMSPAARRIAYACNITYCTNKEVAFDYLKDRIVLRDRPGPIRLQLEKLYGDRSRADKLLMRGLHFAIVDEADSVFIDEARTPLIISGESSEVDPEHVIYREAFNAASELSIGEHFDVRATERSIDLTPAGQDSVERFPWKDAAAYTTKGQREEVVRKALTAQHLFDRDKHYLVREGKVEIIDEYTGRVMPDRSWEQGLHQLVEIKEACEMTKRKETLARISYQRFFRRYMRLAGMTGTAREVTEELWTAYGLRIVSIPTNRPLLRARLPEHIHLTEAEKWQAVVERAAEMRNAGRPVLIGTRSVGASEVLSRGLDDAGLPHRVLNARQDKDEADIIAEAGRLARITVATNMAGRGTDIKLEMKAREVGGLHVIATERHDAARIDRQLFGRCGRQGDPGTCEMFLSLEDELVRDHGNRLLRKMVAAGLIRPGNRMALFVGRLLFRTAQRSAERRHRKMRRDLLKIDEQMSDALAFSGRSE